MQPRQHFIDWVRVLAFLLLIFFHCAMPFVIFNWEIKDTHQSIGLSWLIWWLHQWRIPLLFFVSGVGLHYSLSRRSVLYFIGERWRRLLLPLLFAMFFTIPLQVYFEWLQKGKITGSYFNFYPQVWEMVPYPDGALTWSHMWFVVYLFVYCMLLLPVFALFKVGALARLKTKLAAALGHPIAAVSLFLPLSCCFYFLYIKYPEQQSLLDDWFLFSFCLLLLLYGYVLAASPRIWDTCEKYRHYFLATAAACALVLSIHFWWNFNLPKAQDGRLYLFGTLNALHIWLLILSFMGYAKKHLNRSSHFLVQANQAVYPFYILHQTIIVAAGYYVVQWSLPIVAKLAILILVTFTALNLVYTYLIRPYIIPRILYGLKPKEPKRRF